MPNYFYLALTICMLLLTLAIVARIFSMILISKQSRLIKRLEKENLKLACEINDRSYQLGVLECLRKLKNDRPDLNMQPLLYTANKLPRMQYAQIHIWNNEIMFVVS